MLNVIVAFFVESKSLVHQILGTIKADLHSHAFVALLSATQRSSLSLVSLMWKMQILLTGTTVSPILQNWDPCKFPLGPILLCRP